MIGPEGAGVLTTLAAADIRLVVVDPAGRCALSHDCLAEAVSHVLASPAARRSLAVDQVIIDLQRTVGQKAELYRGDRRDTSALMLKRRQRQMIQKVQDVLLGNAERRAWWDASWKAHRRRLRVIYGAVALAAVALIMVGWTWYGAHRRNDRDLLRQQLVDAPGGEPDYGLLVRLSREHPYPWTEIPSPLPAGFSERIDPEVFGRQPWPHATLEPDALLDAIERSHSLFLESRTLFGAMRFCRRGGFGAERGSCGSRSGAGSLVKDQARLHQFSHGERRVGWAACQGVGRHVEFVGPVAAR